jgi:diguanylate cyclase (GGDEF)-like protein
MKTDMDTLTTQRYHEAVHKIVLQRSRFLLLIGGFLYTIFAPLDSLVYPAYGRVFNSIRFAGSACMLVQFLLTFWEPVRKRIVWVADFSMLFLHTSVIVMIYMADGVQSPFYDGIACIMIGSLVMDSFHFRHIFMVYLITVIFYTIAVVANTAHWSFARYCFVMSYMVSTAGILLCMAKLYTKEHLRGFLGQLKLETMYVQADTLSKIDDLTQIHNRRYFTEVLSDKIKKSGKSKKSFYLVFFDIDHFKTINDKYGHLFGDYVIKEVVTLVRRHIKATSQMGRYGGDEFVFFIDMVNKEAFMTRLEEIRENVRNLIIRDKGNETAVSLSFGAVFVDLSRYQEAQVVIDVADQAMLEVKKKKRGEIYLVD